MSEDMSARERAYRMQGLSISEQLDEGLVDLADLALEAPESTPQELLEEIWRDDEERNRLEDLLDEVYPTPKSDFVF